MSSRGPVNENWCEWKTKASLWPDDQSSQSCSSFSTLVLILTSCNGEPLPAFNLFWSFLLHKDRDQGLVVVGLCLCHWPCTASPLSPVIYELLFGTRYFCPALAVEKVFVDWLTVVGFPCMGWIRPHCGQDSCGWVLSKSSHNFLLLLSSDQIKLPLNVLHLFCYFCLRGYIC